MFLGVCLVVGLGLENATSYYRLCYESLILSLIDALSLSLLHSLCSFPWNFTAQNSNTGCNVKVSCAAFERGKLKELSNLVSCPLLFVNIEQNEFILRAN